VPRASRIGFYARYRSDNRGLGGFRGRAGVCTSNIGQPHVVRNWCGAPCRSDGRRVWAGLALEQPPRVELGSLRSRLAPELGAGRIDAPRTQPILARSFVSGCTLAAQGRIQNRDTSRNGRHGAVYHWVRGVFGGIACQAIAFLRELTVRKNSGLDLPQIYAAMKRSRRFFKNCLDCGGLSTVVIHNFC